MFYNILDSFIELGMDHTPINYKTLMNTIYRPEIRFIKKSNGWIELAATDVFTVGMWIDFEYGFFNYTMHIIPYKKCYNHEMLEKYNNNDEQVIITKIMRQGDFYVKFVNTYYLDVNQIFGYVDDNSFITCKGEYV